MRHRSSESRTKPQESNQARKIIRFRLTVLFQFDGRLSCLGEVSNWTQETPDPRTCRQNSSSRRDGDCMRDSLRVPNHEPLRDNASQRLENTKGIYVSSLPRSSKTGSGWLLMYTGVSIRYKLPLRISNSTPPRHQTQPGQPWS